MRARSGMRARLAELVLNDCDLETVVALQDVVDELGSENRESAQPLWHRDELFGQGSGVQVAR